MDDQSRNLILATALSFLVLLGWFLVGPILFPNAFPPPIEEAAPGRPGRAGRARSRRRRHRRDAGARGRRRRSRVEAVLATARAPADPHRRASRARSR